MPASTSRVSETKESKINIKTKIKRDKISIKEENSGVKNVNLPSNHNSMFRQAGPSFSFGAGVKKIGGKEGEGCGTLAPSTSRGRLGIAWKGERFGEVETNRDTRQEQLICQFQLFWI